MRLLCLSFLATVSLSSLAAIDCIWLSYKTNDPSKIVINWETEQPGDSMVQYGLTADLGQTVKIDEGTTLHQVEIPIAQRGVVYHYKVSSGTETSAVHSFRSLPTDKLRVALVADWQDRKNLDALLQEDIHLLLTGGDNIACLHADCGIGVKDCVKPYSKLIRSYPKLFSSVAFMPAIGNHDREIRPRGDKPPPEPVYDVEATAFKKFFELPDDEWKWRFEVPELGVRFIALDIQHTSDMGTTYQTCHEYKKGTAQHDWYSALMNGPQPKFVVTIYNERNSNIRQQDNPPLHTLFSKSSIAITGFGYFAERAEVDGFSYYNTSLSGKGAKYTDPKSKFFASEDSYILMSFESGKPQFRVEIKGLNREVLHAMDEPHKSNP